jgi:orotate phosphoribosyltransferase-like protein
LFEITKTDEVNRLIRITKSDSGISGPDLAKAHMELGKLLGKEINFEPIDTTIVSILRGGIFFATGIYLQTKYKFELYDPKNEEFKRPNTKNIILVDSVINTGKTIKSILTPDMIVACCVINEKAVRLFENQLYTIRVSKNSFLGTSSKKQIGEVGPDTTMRLFNQI